jgi:hypothetical protein
VNVPDIAPPAIVHTGPEISPLGDDEIVHPPVSPVAKFEPVTTTATPGRPAAGNSAIPGVTRKSAIPKSAGEEGIEEYPKTTT